MSKKVVEGERVMDPLVESEGGVEEVGGGSSGGEVDEAAVSVDEGDGSSEGSGDGQEAVDGGSIEKPAYTPKFKYKVLGEEKDMPEWVRPLIKSEEDEKRYKDLFEKADAIDHFKNSNREIRERYSAVESELSALKSEISELGEFVRKGDFESFFERLHIRPDDVLMWAVKYAELKQNPQQYQAYQASRQKEMQYQEAQRRASEVERNAEERLLEFIRRDAQVTLSDPEVQAYEAEFDRRVGRKGAFREEIAARGDRAYAKGQILTTAEIIREIRGLYNFNVPQATPASAQVSVTNKQRPPVIPSVGGSSRSPVTGNRPKSIEDLDKILEKWGE